MSKQKKKEKTKTKKTIEVSLPNYADNTHLSYVKEQMKQLGSPVIRVVWSKTKKKWFAIEGSHRLTAAKEKKITPVFVDVTNKKAISNVYYYPVTSGEKVKVKELKNYFNKETKPGTGPTLKFKRFQFEN